MRKWEMKFLSSPSSFLNHPCRGFKTPRAMFIAASWPCNCNIMNLQLQHHDRAMRTLYGSGNRGAGHGLTTDMASQSFCRICNPTELNISIWNARKLELRDCKSLYSQTCGLQIRTNKPIFSVLPVLSVRHFHAAAASSFCAFHFFCVTFILADGGAASGFASIFFSPSFLWIRIIFRNFALGRAKTPQRRCLPKSYGKQ